MPPGDHCGEQRAYKENGYFGKIDGKIRQQPENAILFTYPYKSRKHHLQTFPVVEIMILPGRRARFLIDRHAFEMHLEGVTVNKESGSSTRKDHNLYDRKGLQVMLSGFVRIRKQYGVFWLLTNLAVYLAEIPVFFICTLFATVIPGWHDKFTFPNLGGYVRNIFRVLGWTGRMIRNKPTLYKTL